MAKPLGESIWRRSPDTMPLERLPLSPNGAPIATTGSPIRTAPESPNAERRHVTLATPRG